MGEAIDRAVDNLEIGSSFRELLLAEQQALGEGAVRSVDFVVKSGVLPGPAQTPEYVIKAQHGGEDSPHLAGSPVISATEAAAIRQERGEAYFDAGVKMRAMVTENALKMPDGTNPALLGSPNFTPDDMAEQATRLADLQQRGALVLGVLPPDFTHSEFGLQSITVYRGSDGEPLFGHIEGPVSVEADDKVSPPQTSRVVTDPGELEALGNHVDALWERSDQDKATRLIDELMGQDA